MAGEWIPIDCNLGTKPEVLELVDVTGEPVEAVVYRLIQLWSWASMNTADGSIRCTPARLRAVAGGDETFWLAVEQVGWVSFEGGHMTITGWDKRFSKSAKARLHDNRRKSLERSFSSRGLAVAKTAAAVAVSVVTVLTRSRRLSVGSTSISRPITAVPAKLPPWPLH
jgi:hypothetical protein